MDAKENKIKVAYVFTRCVKSGPTQQTLNIIKNLDQNIFESYLVTMYNEPDLSGLESFKKYVKQHFFAPTSKVSVLLGNTDCLQQTLKEIKPDIVHTVGVFPNYAVSRIGIRNHITTVRNFLYEDYVPKFGKIKGYLLGRINLAGLSRTDKVVACARALAEKWKKRYSLVLGYIRNGVELTDYYSCSSEQKRILRRQLNLPGDRKIVIYSGVICERKNQSFLIDVFRRNEGLKDVFLLLAGDGDLYDEIKKSTIGCSNVTLLGHVDNIRDYLQASDLYVSTSKSEGMPNGVLEAMACGLPVVLSDIEQHKEIFEECADIGYLYEQGNIDDCGAKLLKLLSEDFAAKGKICERLAKEKFSAEEMSKKYQDLYLQMVDGKI